MGTGARIEEVLGTEIDDIQVRPGPFPPGHHRHPGRRRDQAQAGRPVAPYDREEGTGPGGGSGMMAAGIDQGTGFFTMAVTTAAGRVVETEGDADEIHDWLIEFGKAITLVPVDIHELTETELNSMPGFWSSPGA